jgi:hypothetical protein
VLIETVMLASLTSLAGGAAALGNASAAPMWAAYLLAVQAPWRSLQLTPPCTRSKRIRSSFGCFATSPGPLVAQSLPAEGSYAHPELQLSALGHGLSGTLGGFRNFDLASSIHLRVGPELSWLTPDSPREDLLRLRVVSPGWGVRYTWDDANVSVGVAACTRFVMFGEDFPVVDMLSSEARLEFRLP